MAKRIGWDRGHDSGMCLLRCPVERLWNHCCRTRGCRHTRSTAERRKLECNAAQMINMLLTGRTRAVGLSSGLTLEAIVASVFDHDFLVLLCSATIGLAGGFLYGMLIIPRKHTGEETSIDTPDSAPQVDQH